MAQTMAWGRIAARPVREGQADRALATELRGGKSAALNLARRLQR